MPERSTIVPATQVSKVEWTSFSLTNIPATDALGNLISAKGASMQFATHIYLGDPLGIPLQAIRLNNDQSSRYFEAEQLTDAEFFGEIVTRADGTQLTILELLNEKLNAAIPTSVTI